MEQTAFAKLAWLSSVPFYEWIIHRSVFSSFEMSCAGHAEVLPAVQFPSMLPLQLSKLRRESGVCFWDGRTGNSWLSFFKLWVQGTPWACSALGTWKGCSNVTSNPPFPTSNTALRQPRKLFVNVSDAPRPQCAFATVCDDCKWEQRNT